MRITNDTVFRVVAQKKIERINKVKVDKGRRSTYRRLYSKAILEHSCDLEMTLHSANSITRLSSVKLSFGAFKPYRFALDTTREIPTLILMDSSRHYSMSDDNFNSLLQDMKDAGWVEVSLSNKEEKDDDEDEDDDDYDYEEEVED